MKRTYQVPHNSKIRIEQKENELIIFLPYRKGNGDDFFSRGLALVSVLLLGILVIEMIKDFLRDISAIDWVWLIIFLLGGLIGVWQLYILVRDVKSETIRLKPKELLFNSGISPLYASEKQDALIAYSYLSKRKEILSFEDIKMLVLSATKDKSLYLLTFENQSKAIYLGYRMSNEERKWLYECILDFYNLKHFYRMIETNENRQKKERINLLLWLVPLIVLVLLVEK